MNKKIIFSTTGIIAVIALLLAYLLGWFDADEPRSDNTESEPERFYSQLTGEEVEESKSQRPILATVIENSPAARPQYGLDAAGWVYEVPTEGGVTRMLAFYQEDMPQTIGPIRSLRPYMADWVAGFDASIAHVGGSGEALQQVERQDIRTLDELQYGNSYRRDPNRQAPHNMFADTQDLRDLQEELGHEGSEFSTFERREEGDKLDKEEQVDTITIDYSTQEYQAEFTYNSDDNRYERRLAGADHIDAATDEVISAHNVIVVYTDREPTTAEGGGEAVLFRDGRALTAEWNKSDNRERMQFLDEEGQELALNRGATWVAAVPRDRSVEY